MSEQRKRRTTEERISEIDVKIEAHKKNIAVLEAKKKNILNPKPRKVLSMSAIMKKAKEKGYSVKDIAKKLDIDVDE